MYFILWSGSKIDQSCYLVSMQRRNSNSWSCSETALFSSIVLSEISILHQRVRRKVMQFCFLFESEDDAAIKSWHDIKSIVSKKAQWNSKNDSLLNVQFLLGIFERTSFNINQINLLQMKDLIHDSSLQDFRNVLLAIFFLTWLFSNWTL